MYMSAVDGTHIPIKEPTEDASDFINRGTDLLMFKPLVTTITDSLMWL